MCTDYRTARRVDVRVRRTRRTSVFRTSAAVGRGRFLWCGCGSRMCVEDATAAADYIPLPPRWTPPRRPPTNNCHPHQYTTTTTTSLLLPLLHRTTEYPIHILHIISLYGLTNTGEVPTRTRVISVYTVRPTLNSEAKITLTITAPLTIYTSVYFKGGYRNPPTRRKMYTTPNNF